MRRNLGGVDAAAAGERALQTGQLREGVVGAEIHLPHVAGAAADSIAAQRFVGTGGGALANDDEAEEARSERRAEVHAVHLDVRVGKIDVVVMSDEYHDLVCLARGDLMLCGLRCEAGGGSGESDDQAQGERKKRAAHTSSLMFFGRAVQYN